ncbi:hypothetical protein GQX74_010166 [Glossina fuscipes]|nr:hypothetical protein GQX74_010166 [Glossina fuscipes]
MSLCALKFMFLPLFFVLLASRNGSAIWCYRCTSSTPGCGEDFSWRGIGYLGEQCSENKDICVKVIERRGAKEIITRDCLSSLSLRTDIPADKYEGCRPAANDVHLAHYVNHTVKEHDVKHSRSERIPRPTKASSSSLSERGPRDTSVRLHHYLTDARPESASLGTRFPLAKYNCDMRTNSKLFGITSNLNNINISSKNKVRHRDIDID